MVLRLGLFVMRVDVCDVAVADKRMADSWPCATVCRGWLPWKEINGGIIKILRPT